MTNLSSLSDQIRSGKPFGSNSCCLRRACGAIPAMHSRMCASRRPSRAARAEWHSDLGGCWRRSAGSWNAEPRWAAAPQTGFESDLTGNEGLYRIMVDPDWARSRTVVALQAPPTWACPLPRTGIYFGFSTDGSGGTLAKGRRDSSKQLGATDPTDAASFQHRDP